MKKVFQTAMVVAVLGFGAGHGVWADTDSRAISLPIEETVEGNQFASYCETDLGHPAIRLKVRDLKDDKGNIRVQLYNDDPEAFLAKGAKLLRIVVPVQSEDEAIDVCVPLNSNGTYALFVMHDRDEDGKPDVFSEGFGISNNPKLKLRKPRHDEAAFIVGDETLDMDINMQYFGGNKKSRRRRGRR